MDTKIKDKDLDVNFLGLPYSIKGLEASLQKAYICLSLKKGGFIYNKDLGMDMAIYKESGILAAAENALAGTGIVPLKAEVLDEHISITVSTPYGIGTIDL